MYYHNMGPLEVKDHGNNIYLGQKRCASCHCASATAWPAMAHASLESIGIKERRSPIITSSNWQVVLRNLRVCEGTIHCRGAWVTRMAIKRDRGQSEQEKVDHHEEQSIDGPSSLTGWHFPPRGAHLRKAWLQPALPPPHEART